MSSASDSPPSAVDDCASAIHDSMAARGVKRKVADAKDVAATQTEVDTLLRVDYGTDRYRQLLSLRERVLRAPLGLSLWQENLTLEAQQQHYALFRRDAAGTSIPVACVTAVLMMDKTPPAARLRQMAVAPECQRQGLGQRLMQAVEQQLRQEGVGRVELHARVTARDFYQRLGYRESGEIFVEVTIPHVCMVRELAGS